MSAGQPSILSAISLDESSPTLDSVAPSKPRDRKKPMSNRKAAAVAREAGAKTATERALESTVQEMNVLLQRQSEAAKTTKQKNNLNILLDKMGSMSSSDLYSEDGFQAAKRLIPSLNKETYFNSLAPKAAQRAMLTRQLSAIPVGTPLPRATLNQLSEVGIESPNQYMSLSVRSAPGTFLGAIEETAIAQAEAGQQRAPLFAAGVGLKRAEDALRSATQLSIEEDIQKGIQSSRALESKLKAEGPLTTSQKVNAASSFGKDLQRTTGKVDTLYEFWNNIQDLSDPKKSVSTVRLDGKEAVKVSNKNSFQNVRDIGLLYSFIKMLDPESVVREGEIKMNDRATGALQSLGINMTKIIDGEILDQRQRNGILSVANTTMVNGSEFLKDEVELAENRVNEFGLKRNTVISKKVDRVLDKVAQLKEAQAAVQSTDAAPEPAPVTGTFNVGNIKVEVLPD